MQSTTTVLPVTLPATVSTTTTSVTTTVTLLSTVAHQVLPGEAPPSVAAPPVDPSSTLVSSVNVAAGFIPLATSKPLNPEDTQVVHNPEFVDGVDQWTIRSDGELGAVIIPSMGHPDSPDGDENAG